MIETNPISYCTESNIHLLVKEDVVLGTDAERLADLVHIVPDIFTVYDRRAFSRWEQAHQDRPATKIIFFYQTNFYSRSNDILFYYFFLKLFYHFVFLPWANLSVLLQYRSSSRPSIYNTLYLFYNNFL